MIKFDIQVRKNGVFIKQYGEETRLDDNLVDEIIRKLVSYACYRDKKEIMIFGDKEKFDF
ncbi:hypothetical protein [Fusobacterium nucleatum]|uniref:hypothetical protein n=1 Tax=Fusobacterium nucleatum TaxID=851 RepID=UPI0030D32890